MFDSKGLFLNLALFLKYVQKSQEYLNFKEMLTHTKERYKTAYAKLGCLCANKYSACYYKRNLIIIMLALLLKCKINSYV